MLWLHRRLPSGPGFYAIDAASLSSGCTDRAAIWVEDHHCAHRPTHELSRLGAVFTLWVADENAPAIRIYKKVGFIEEGRARESFRRDGKWHDMITMGLLEGERRG